MIQKVAFTMYPVIDLNRAIEFYERMFELKPTKLSAEGAWVEYDLPQGGCFVLTTLAEGVLPSSTAGGSVAFEVDDLENLMKTLKDQKVTVKLDILGTPVCSMAVILDSEGNAVTLHQLKQRS